MSKTYTEEEIRAAAKVIQSRDTVVRINPKDLIAELTKPAIHPDVPVMFRDTSGINVSTARFTGEGYPTRTNIRPLVPIDAAVDKAHEILRQDASTNTGVTGNFIRQFKAWRDHYLETGETE